MNNWRLLIDPPKSGLENMAVDEAILHSCNQGLSQPTFRLYEWSKPTLSIGCFQKDDKIIERSFKTGISYVRRITGGRAVLHIDEITYSIVCSENEWLFEEGISGAYRIISRCLLEALREVGVNAEMQNVRCETQDGGDSQKVSCFHSPSKYEIMVEKKKLVGSAQRRFKRAFLQHGSILFGINRELIMQLFGKQASQRMAWLELYSKVKKNEFRAILINKIREGLDIDLIAGHMNDHEKYLKDKLIQEKNMNYELQIINS
jgi:lipoate-protein ligase A